MSVTPAAELARCKITYPAWQLTHCGDLFIARERMGRRVIRQPTLAALENELIRVDWLSNHNRKGSKK